MTQGGGRETSPAIGGRYNPTGYERDRVRRRGIPEGGYEAHALGQAIFTEAETLEELKARVRDAVLCHFEEETRPRLIRLHVVKDELLLV